MKLAAFSAPLKKKREKRRHAHYHKRQQYRVKERRNGDLILPYVTLGPGPTPSDDNATCKRRFDRVKDNRK